MEMLTVTLTHLFIMSETEVEAADVIRLLQQFLKENHLTSTLKALQEETNVMLNSVDNVESIVSDVNNGRWDVVLQTISQLRLPERKLMDLYEQLTIELIEQRELNAARSVLRQTEPMQAMKARNLDRFLHLEQLVGRTFFDPREAYPEGSSKEKRRAAIAESLASEVAVIPPSRLMTLIHQALRWQQYQGLLPIGGPYDILRGTASSVASQEDVYPTTLMFTVSFGKSHAECARFSPDGHFLVTGSIDGLIEVRSALTGKLRSDLAFQEMEEYMMMDTAVTALAFSRDSEMIASGSHDGSISLWKVQTGSLVRSIPKAHAQGVTSLCFSRDGSQILSASFDTTVRMYGLKSGKVMREFRGHTSFVNDVSFSVDGSRVISASSDGTVRVWDARSSECLAALRPRHGASDTATVAAPSVSAAIALPRNPEHLLVVDRTNELSVMSTRGQALATLAATNPDSSVVDAHFLAAAVSFRGQYAFAAAEDNKLYCFNLETNKLDFVLPVHTTKEIVGVTAHPHMPLVVTYSTDGTLRAWKAAA